MRELIETYRNLTGLTENAADTEHYYKWRKAQRDSETAHEASRTVRSARDHIGAMHAHTAAADSHEHMAQHTKKQLTNMDASSKAGGWFGAGYHAATANYHRELAKLHAHHGGE